MIICVDTGNMSIEPSGCSACSNLIVVESSPVRPGNVSNTSCYMQIGVNERHLSYKLQNHLQTERLTDRHNFIGPFSLHSGPINLINEGYMLYVPLSTFLPVVLDAIPR